ncbi:O-antigen ligase family protein [Egbenema bharatensis]|uniref:O-antigen ligase family protein n=1 Tax=Egbenema bharatensis TaxID=3463334 RepID=UPI003A8A80F9
MQEILFDPLLLPVILLTSLVYLVFLFNLLTKNKSASTTAEKIISSSVIFILPGVTVFPFDKIHPSALAGHDKTAISAMAQLGLYFVLAFMVSSRIPSFIKSFPNTLKFVLLRNPFLLFLILLTPLSAAWSHTPFLSLKASLVLLGLSLVATYMGSQYSWDELWSRLRLSSGMWMVLSTVFAIAVPSIGRHGKGWGGVVGHPTNLGPIAAMSAVLWGVQLASQKKPSWQTFGITGLSLLVVVMTDSAGALVIFALLASTAIAFRVLKKTSLRWKLVMGFLLIVLPIVASAVVALNLEFLLGLLGKDLTFTGRAEFWPQLINELQKRYLLGYGYHSFWQPWLGAANPAAHIVNANEYRPPHAHNGFLDLALSLGIVGLSFFVISLVANTILAVKHFATYRNIESVLPMIMLAFLIFKNMTETGTWGLRLDAFLYILLSVRLCTDIRRRVYG